MIRRKFFLMFFISMIGFSFGITAIQINAVVYDPIAEILGTNRLVLELDMNELSDFVGRIFEVNFTAATKAATVTVTMYFDDLIQLPVWQQTSDFFINERAIIDITESDLIPGIGHEFTILAEDSDNQTAKIEQMITIDTIGPSFTQLSLEHMDKDNQPTLVTTNTVELKDGEYLRLNYTVFDVNFDCVRIFIDTRTDLQKYPSSMSINLGSGVFVIELYGVVEQTFDLRIIAYDKALNEEEYLWSVKFSKSDGDSMPQEMVDLILEQEKAKRKQAAWTAGIIAIIFTVIGACFGIVGSNLFIKRSGIQSVMDNDQSTGYDDEQFLRKEDKEEEKEPKAIVAAKKYGKQQLEKEQTREETKKEKQEPEKELKKRMIGRRFGRWFLRKWRGE